MADKTHVVARIVSDSSGSEMALLSDGMVRFTAADESCQVPSDTPSGKGVVQNFPSRS